MKRDYCKPCAMIMAEKYDLKPIPCGKDNKVTCWRCKLRKYGMTYEQRRKAAVKCS